MQFNLKSLFLWFLVFHFFIEGGLDNYIRYGEIDSISISDTAFSLSTLISFFMYWLVSYSVLYKFYPNRKWLFILGGMVFSFVIPIFFRYLLEQNIMRYFIGYNNYPDRHSFNYYVFDQYLFATRYIPFGVIYFFIRYSLYKQQQEKELTIQNQKMELSLLRGQINPHFLMNSLNNIQSLVYLQSDKAPEAIDHLADLLKYTLYQNKKWITIQEEMVLIDKYISLERLRHDYEFILNIDIDENLNNTVIPQYLLLPLFENAFKHAQLKSKTHPFSLSLKKTAKGVLIQSSNEIATRTKDAVGGIGLENLRKRLELLYEQNFTMEIVQNKPVFKIEIILPFQ